MSEDTELLQEINQHLKSIDGMLANFIGAYMGAMLSLAHNYRGSRKSARRKTKGKHTRAQWEALKAVYEYACLKCGRKEPEIILTRDHIKPVTKGGTNDISNIQPLCPQCGHDKGDEEIDYRPKP